MDNNPDAGVENPGHWWEGNKERIDFSEEPEIIEGGGTGPGDDGGDSPDGDGGGTNELYGRDAGGTGNSNENGRFNEYFHAPQDYVERPSDYGAAEVVLETKNGENVGRLTATHGLDSVSIRAHSGNALWNKIPPGAYDIVRGPNNFRLEMQDSTYGNDESDVWGTGRWGIFDLYNLRLHGPGERGNSLGCVTIGSYNGDVSPQARSDWSRVRNLIEGSFSGYRTVDKVFIGSKRFHFAWTFGGIWGTEPVEYFGTLKVREE